MAGLSSRFIKQGYTKPKYQLEISDRPLFDYCILSFKRYFDSESFLFIVRANADQDFVNERINRLGIKNAHVMVLGQDTRGQAETVYLGLQNTDISNQSLTIFNIDTIRPNFRFPEVVSTSDGYLEVFRGDGEGWSFIDVDEETDCVKRTTEKVRISDLCSTGLYFFKDAQVFIDLFEKISKEDVNLQQGGEYYVAPMYNLLIEKGYTIRYHEIALTEVLFSGIPSEYEALKKQSHLLTGI